MPELPEVETTCRAIRSGVEGKILTKMQIKRRDLRWSITDVLPRVVLGQVCRQVKRRGKYILIYFDSGIVLIHLGMSGSLRWVHDKVWRVHDHVMMQWGDAPLHYCDPRRFGLILWYEASCMEDIRFLQGLGLEPLTEEFDGRWLYQQTRGSKQPIKSWLMNAKNIVGVGNIYANEALFRSGIHPLKLAGELSQKSSQKLNNAIKTVLSTAIDQGGTTLRDFHTGEGQPGYFKQSLMVYGRAGQACFQCHNPLEELRISARQTVFCGRCQKQGL